MGLNSGEVVVGTIGNDLRMTYTAMGKTVGLAQRMEQLAEPGKAYLSEYTAPLVAGYFDLRLILRRWAPGDRHSMVALWRDPAVWRALRPGVPFDPHHGESDFARQLSHWDEHGFGLWAISERRGGQTIGWIGPTHPVFIPELAREVELGWTLRRGFWGQGLATEGAKAALDAIFSHGPWRYVISIIHPQNQRSAGVAKRMGMKHQHDVLDPTIEQHVGVWKLRREDWQTTGRTQG
jgi:RimJ/RimL family protein N-acetyltransferase